MRVAMVPDWRRINPYQSLLADALLAEGIEVLFWNGYRRVLPISRAFWGDAPDVVHMHWPSGFLKSQRPALRAIYCLRTLLDAALMKARGAKLVWTLHNLVTHDTPTPKIERWFSSRLAGLADEVISHTPAAKSEAAAVLGISEQKIRVIPHGSFRSVYGELPDCHDARKELVIPPDTPVVLFFGMVRPYKGISKLFDAWAGIKHHRADALLLVVGSASDPEYGRQVLEQSKSVDNVVVDLRFVPDEEVTSLLAIAECMVLPFEDSLTSGSLVLAQNYGLPVVTLKTPGTVEQENAIYADGAEPSDLGAAILEGLSGNKATAQHELEWSQVAKQHVLAYSNEKLRRQPA